MTDPVSKVREDYTADKNSGKRSLKQITYFVIHDAEAPLPDTGAEAIGRYFSGKNSRGSTHFGVDNNSTQRYLADNVIAWGAPPINISAIHVECAGKASFSRDKWLADYGPMMKRLAWLIVTTCKAYNIPLEILTPAQLKKKGINPPHGQGGIVTHATVNKVWDDSDHWDPGPNFPIDVVITWMNALTDTPVKARTINPTLHIHSKGSAVKRLQKILKIAVTGVFDKKTEQAVRKFQKSHKLVVDGIVGPKTWKALAS